MRELHVPLIALAALGAACSPAPFPETPSVAPVVVGVTPGRAPERPVDHVPTRQGDLSVTAIHHGTVLLEWLHQAIYIDPWHEGDLQGLPKADFIFITDIHQDHMDPQAIELLRKQGTVVVGPPAVGEKVKLDVTLKNGESRSLGIPSIGPPSPPMIGVEAVPMYNMVRGPAPGALFHDKGRGNGYVLTFADVRVYLSGDTECTPEMKALDKIDLAFVCMNLPYTMPPAEAAACIQAFHPKVVIPYHYRGQDPGELDAALRAQQVRVLHRNFY